MRITLETAATLFDLPAGGVYDCPDARMHQQIRIGPLRCQILLSIGSPNLLAGWRRSEMS